MDVSHTESSEAAWIVCFELQNLSHTLLLLTE